MKCIMKMKKPCKHRAFRAERVGFELNLAIIPATIDNPHRSGIFWKSL